MECPIRDLHLFQPTQQKHNRETRSDRCYQSGISQTINSPLSNPGLNTLCIIIIYFITWHPLEISNNLQSVTKGGLDLLSERLCGVQAGHRDMTR